MVHAQHIPPEKNIWHIYRKVWLYSGKILIRNEIQVWFLKNYSQITHRSDLSTYITIALYIWYQLSTYRCMQLLTGPVTLNLTNATKVLSDQNFLNLDEIVPTFHKKVFLAFSVILGLIIFFLIKVKKGKFLLLVKRNCFAYKQERKKSLHSGAKT